MLEEVTGTEMRVCCYAWQVPATYTQVLADTQKTGTGDFQVVLPTATPMAWDSYVVFYKVTLLARLVCCTAATVLLHTETTIGSWGLQHSWCAYSYIAVVC